MTRGCLGNHRESYTSVQLVCANSYDKKNKLKTVKLSIIFFFNLKTGEICAGVALLTGSAGRRQWTFHFIPLWSLCFPGCPCPPHPFPQHPFGTQRRRNLLDSHPMVKLAMGLSLANSCEGERFKTWLCCTPPPPRLPARCHTARHSGASNSLSVLCGRRIAHSF